MCPFQGIGNQFVQAESLPQWRLHNGEASPHGLYLEFHGKMWTEMSQVADTPNGAVVKTASKKGNPVQFLVYL